MTTYELKQAVIKEFEGTGYSVHRVLLRYVPGKDGKQMQVMEIHGAAPDGTAFAEILPAHPMHVDPGAHLCTHIREKFLPSSKPAPPDATKH